MERYSQKPTAPAATV